MSEFDESVSDLYTDAYMATIDRGTGCDQRRLLRASGASVIDKMLETDVETYLPGDLLVKMDIATMASSLECRSPLLDRELMELAARIPAELKIRGRERKVIFRDALRPWLPGDLLDRPKMGFGVPLGAWFRGELRSYVSEVLLDRTRGYFRSEYVEALLARHVAHEADNSARLWALLMTELWHREVVEAPLLRSTGAQLTGNAGGLR